MSTENIGKKSKGKKGKSNSDAMREMREKSANKAKTPAAKAKKSPTPAKQPKPAKDKPAKAAKSKPSQTALVPTIDAEDLKKLQHDAETNEERLKELLPEHVVRGAEIYNVMNDHKQRELWKFGKTPYKSWSAFVAHYAEIVKISERTLFGIIGANKLLPGISAETKKNIGPRKLAKLKNAVKVAEKKGRQVPQSIIDAATKESVTQFESTLQQEGFVEAPLPPPIEPLSMFAEEEIPVAPIASGKPLPHSEPKEQTTGNATVDEAIATAIFVYDRDMKIDEALEFICKQWLLTVCDKEEYTDMTNKQAAAQMKEEESKPKKAKPAKA